MGPKIRPSSPNDSKKRRVNEKMERKLCIRECPIVEHTLAALLNPLGGGTAPRNTSTLGITQHWRQLQIICEGVDEEKGVKYACQSDAATDWVRMTKMPFVYNAENVTN